MIEGIIFFIEQISHCKSDKYDFDKGFFAIL